MTLLVRIHRFLMAALLHSLTVFVFLNMLDPARSLATSQLLHGKGCAS